MKIASEYYLHDSDKAAMTALKAIPGFSQVVKTFMNSWNEQQYKLANMSSKIRLGPEQMPKYYNMLPPICEKLGIAIPELYVEMNVIPNAYTYGDTTPFIVLTSGLLKAMPEELIPTVIAHECGHIACHHTLFLTMGRILRDNLITPLLFSSLGGIALAPIAAAFAYWMRCSEFSSDRAAAICDGSAGNIIQMCMRFAGFDKDIGEEANVDAFLAQAEEYRSLVKDSALNKTVEFITFAFIDHPLIAVRALECREWTQTERYRTITGAMNNELPDSEAMFPVELTPAKYVGKNAFDLQNELITKGFKNITLVPVKGSETNLRDGAVLSFSVNGTVNGPNDWYKLNSVICVEYYQAKTEEELAVERQGQIQITDSAAAYLGKDLFEVKYQLQKLGFRNIKTAETAVPRLMGFIAKVNSVAKVTAGDRTLEKGAWFSPDEEITIHYCVRG